MVKYIKPMMLSGQPVWELPVREDLIYGKPDYVDQRAKYHCFLEGHSLCRKYYQNTDHFDTDIASGEILAFPAVACKTCFEKWKREFDVGI